MPYGRGVRLKIEIAHPTDVRWKKKVGQVCGDGGTISVMDALE